MSAPFRPRAEHEGYLTPLVQLVSEQDRMATVRREVRKLWAAVAVAVVIHHLVVVLVVLELSSARR